MQVIVCEPDAVSGSLLARYLQEDGYTVSLCQTAAACESQFAAGTVQLVVTALLIPDLDGLALVRRLKSKPHPPGVLMLSALQAKARAQEVGADAFLSKPVSRHQFLSTVQWVLARGGGCD